MLNSQVYAFSVALILSSCGLFDKSGGSSDGVQQQRDSAEEDVMMFSVEDTACGSGVSPVATSTTADVWAWNGTEAVKSSKTLTATSGTDGEFMTSGVLGTLRDLYQVSECTAKNGRAVCTEKAQTVDKGTLVKICKASPSYGREALESVTLTSQYFIEEARDIYKTLPSAKTNLMNSVLVVQPRLVKNVKLSDGSYKRYMTADNAGFTSFDSDSTKYGLFIVFPTSKEDYATSPVHLWEVPFVMTHEYGHNVFYKHVGNAATTARLRINVTGGIDHIVGRKPIKVKKPNVQDPNSSQLLPDSDEFEFLSFASDETPAEKALGGANELFADIFSFYVHKGAADLIKGVTCLDKNRDPLVATTFAGTAKAWTATQQSIFEGKTTATERSKCTDIAYDDVHDVAAALSYPVVQLINGMMPGSTDAAKLNVLLKWLDAVATYVTSAGSSATLDGFMKPLVTELLTAKTVSQGTVTTLCTDFKTKASGLTTTSAACQ